MNEKVHHWADRTALKIIREKGDKDFYTLASGITPSGVIHIGNFREVITTELVKRALEKRGKKVRFLFSWDDYDVFRKVPANMPKAEMLKKELRKPIVDVPDPFGETSSYAKYHEEVFEKSVNRMGVETEFIYQADQYRKSIYAQKVRKALEKTSVIKDILNEYRSKPLSEDWLPISIFCGQCSLDEMKEIKYLGEDRISYECGSCRHGEELDLTKTSLIKLLWRIDWPMRWAYEKVDFEPGGKDHSSDGGSFDTGKKIVKAVYGFEAPSYIMYDFIGIKGTGGKISSSKGNIIEIDDLLKIYEPEILRFIFTSYKPNVEFTLSFDLDVLKIYEEYDRYERVYFDEEECSESKKPTIKRAYELAQIKNPPSKKPYQPLFRHFCNVIQIHSFDYEKTKVYYEEKLKNLEDEYKFKNRFQCASYWIKNYSPEDFRFSVLNEKNNSLSLNDEEREILQKIVDFISNPQKWEEKELSSMIYQLIKEKEIDLKTGFRIFYQCLIGVDKGPKLAPFMMIIGREKVLSLIKLVLN